MKATKMQVTKSTNHDKWVEISHINYQQYNATNNYWHAQTVGHETQLRTDIATS